MIVDGSAISKILYSEAYGKRIVMTNGCFDLLHAGHIMNLKAAAALGEVLVVAVNSDDSVRRLKGITRPVVPLIDRMIVLDAMEVVDYVVAFESDTPAELICRVQPDILVKGGDYTPDKIAGAECAGEVVIIPTLIQRSTTSIIEKIKSS